MNVYLDLTREYNIGALRAVLSSGQAVVLPGKKPVVKNKQKSN